MIAPVAFLVGARCRRGKSVIEDFLAQVFLNELVAFIDIGQHIMAVLKILLHTLPQTASEGFYLSPGAGSKDAGNLAFLMPSLSDQHAVAFMIAEIVAASKGFEGCLTHRICLLCEMMLE